MRSIANIRILLILLILLLLTGCSATSAMNQDKPEIYAFLHPADSEYWQQAAWGVEAAVKNNQAFVRIQEVNITDDYDNSMDLIKKAIRKTTKAIIITPFESKELHKLLEKAHKTGIALLYLDTAEPYDIPGTYIYSDNEKASEKAGCLLAESLGKKGKVVMLSIASDDPKALDREKGFQKAIQEYPEMELLNIFHCNGSRENTRKTISDILAAHPDIRGIFAACPETSAGAVAALTASGRMNDIRIVGFDHTTETLNDIGSGLIYAYVGQNSYQLGYQAAETALAVAAGKSVPDRVEIEYDTSGVSNADRETDPQDMIY